MLLPFSKSSRETESGNRGTVVGAALGLSGSGGVSSVEPEMGAGTGALLELGVDLSVFAVAPSPMRGLILEFLSFCRLDGEQSPPSCSPDTAIKKCPVGHSHFLWRASFP